MEAAFQADAIPDRFVIIGEIVKAIGLKGEVKLLPLLDYHAALLLSSHLVWSDGTAAAVVRHRQAGSCEALKLRGVADRNAAEAMVGRELGFMSRSYLAPDFPQPAGGLPFRWLDREVRTAAGEMIGRVDEVRVAGAGYMLVLDDPQQPGRELMIPAVAPILHPENDLAGALIVDLPEGLFDVQRA
jgi:16S rRNA processing protein RimM